MKNLLPNRTFYFLKCLMLMACEFLFIGNFHILWKSSIHMLITKYGKFQKIR